MTRIVPDSRPEQFLQAFDVHGLMEAIGDGLVHQRVVGDLALADEILPAQAI